jgi:hypothetical protein
MCNPAYTSTTNDVVFTRAPPSGKSGVNIRCAFMQEAAKIGGHDLHVMRIKDSSDGILLSCMLQYDPAKGPGTYFDGAVAKFESVRSKWGDEVSLV